MKTLLAAHLVFEMLDGVGDVALVAVQFRFLEASIQQSAGITWRPFGSARIHAKGAGMATQ